jgi:molybdopterin-guanine dinucleotide biosynthesis protein A
MGWDNKKAIIASVVYYSFDTFYFCLMPEQKTITAIILAGGKSSRMKEDKGLVIFNGKMLVQHVIESLKKIMNEIIIITANPAYKQFDYPCIEDTMKGKGPLGGIYTGLINSSTQKNLFVGCDMPFLTERILADLITSCSDEDVLLTEHLGLAEPLCSIYDRSCITHLRSQLEQNHLKITDALAGLKTRVISFDREEWLKGNEFANINSIEELNKYKS